MITYNHALYIAQAIDSVLAQITTFDVEIVIGEDASTDDTRRIVMDYQQRFPDRIRLLLPARNRGARANIQATLQACRGEYVALLEGDDYWINTVKLQAQVDLLDANPAAFLCGARALVWPDGASSHTAISPSDDSDVLAAYGARELFDDRWWFRTCTKMFRRTATRMVPDRFAGDWSATMWLLATTDFAPVCFFDQVVAVYRTHPTGLWTSMPRLRRLAKDSDMLFHLIPLFRDPERRQLLIRMDAYANELASAGRGFRLTALRSAILTALRSPQNRHTVRQLIQRVGLIVANRHP
jgi:glycosyltransferase involved in cell wall biosynthesis